MRAGYCARRGDVQVRDELPRQPPLEDEDADDAEAQVAAAARAARERVVRARARVDGGAEARVDERDRQVVALRL